MINNIIAKTTLLYSTFITLNSKKNKNMKAHIITIGDEILIGQVVDTNSAWMAKELNKIGVSVAQITSITDQPQHLIETLNLSLQKHQIVIITGGLGPTNDDRTKQTLAEFFNSKLILHQPTLDQITKMLAIRNLPLNENNKSQAYQPDNAKILQNTEGTAPGMWFEKEGRVVISMPGVPFEMKYLMSKHIIPEFQKRYNLTPVINRTILTQGEAEAVLAERLQDWENQLPNYISLAYLPSPGMVRLRLSAPGNASNNINAEIEDHIIKLYNIIPEIIYGQENDTLQEIVGRLCKENNITISTAESCTGGTIASMISSVPGASNYFLGSIVAYHNNIKRDLLNITDKTLEINGAVSEIVVKQMVIGACNATKSDFAIATSGIAGPDGGTTDKPVGTTWIAVGNHTHQVAICYQFGNNRERNILRASTTALNMMRNFIEKAIDNYK